MDKNSPVGFFDSGVGGLSVFSRFKKVLPNENTIYFGDLKNLPYGNKSQEELIGFAQKILDFFQTKNVKAVVIACNTSSALAYEHIKDNYEFKIYPIIQSCAKVISQNSYQKIGVFATLGTIKSSAYKKELLKYNPNLKICEIACPNWVSIVEGIYQQTENDIKIPLNEMIEFNPDKIILGCTHYPYLLDKLSKYVDSNLFIDPSQIFVEYIKDDLLKNDSSKIGNEEFFVSANPENFIKNSQLFYPIKNTPKIFEF